MESVRALHLGSCLPPKNNLIPESLHEAVRVGSEPEIRFRILNHCKSSDESLVPSLFSVRGCQLVEAEIHRFFQKVGCNLSGPAIFSFGGTPADYPFFVFAKTPEPQFAKIRWKAKTTKLSLSLLGFMGRLSVPFKRR